MFTVKSTCKGGGYKYCRTDPPHPARNARGLYPLHRVLMENRLGRRLHRWEIVHHVDGNKHNDDIGNLEVMTNAQHSSHHAANGARVGLKCACGTVFYLKPHDYRRRNKCHKTTSCSLKCSALARAD